VTTPHVPPDQLACYLAGEALPFDRARIQDHLAGCPACRHEAVAVARIVHADRRARVARRVVATAAGLATLTAIVVATTTPRMSTLRSSNRQAATPSVLGAVAPIGEVAGTPKQVRFVWRSAASAVEYRLTVADSTGSVLWSQTSTDTVIGLPSELALRAGATYYWFVDGLLADGRSLTTGSREFRLAP
jgi:anti-sigma factor RsiW